MYAERNKASKNFRTWKKYTSKRMLIIFGKKLIVMTKFPDNSLTLVKWTKFPDIFSKFPDNSLTWRKFCFSLTRGNPDMYNAVVENYSQMAGSSRIIRILAKQVAWQRNATKNKIWKIPVNCVKLQLCNKCLFVSKIASLDADVISEA